ncbi:MAG TPA: LLM class flavin-dependent oxidoreductase [Chloroflexota bacterium]|nr:LLM class flavin-dependent oxidoreductase [Chloroflexota bacterium]
MARRLSITVDLAGSDDDRARTYGYVQAADEAGVETVFVTEAWGREPFGPLAILADRTTRITLGTSIVNIFSRTPAALAQHFTTLDEISGGRAIAGLGTSGKLVIEEFHGIPFEKPATRLRETILIMRTLFAGEPLRFDGEVFKFGRGFTLRFTPFRPNIPIYLASFRPAGMRLVAELADGWLPMMIPLERLTEQVAEMRAMVAKAGRDPASVVAKSPGPVIVTRDVAAARLAQKRNLAYYVARMGVYYHTHLTAMGRGEEVDAIRKAWDEGSSTAGASAVSDDLSEAFARIVTPDQLDDAVARLDQQIAAGVDLHQIVISGVDDAAEQKHILEHLVGK